MIYNFYNSLIIYAMICLLKLHLFALKCVILMYFLVPTDAQFFFPAAHRNRVPILEVLKKYVKKNTIFLEIGSGSGQHVAHFAQNFPTVEFQPSEMTFELMFSISGYINKTKLSNIRDPLAIDVIEDPKVWNISYKPESVDYLYASNLFHTAFFEAIDGFFKAANYFLKPNGLVFTYGPFLYDHKESAPSNIKYDKLIRENIPQWRVRNVDSELIPAAVKHNIFLQKMYDLPVNNQLLVWIKNVTKTK